MFGGPRLKHRIQEHAVEDGLIDSLVKELEAFVGKDWQQEDDVTLVLLKRAREEIGNQH